ncbi:uncharacterized protein LOC111625049 isoform X3 [Centruroides sculpturatus]|uniref:uncharacterized protein LOC111625049 isoform X2 n=1 Tax=Centruroides sculpturatus TaxID=218467 RepID=UPI000C6DE304|nr:uncharacterized protein LOC111625049 isoform X2 [Centruroides sculpturatus]XP_023223842.1 uncharacterized protein LOC111625049 isoform X3 [Centruroides sculpturatus]
MEHRRNKRKPLTPNHSFNLKLKRRNNERLRHHSINKVICELCKLIPGDCENETKVLRLQRVKRYCYYLNSTIRKFAKELNSNFKIIHLRSSKNRNSNRKVFKQYGKYKKVGESYFPKTSED